MLRPLCRRVGHLWLLVCLMAAVAACAGTPGHDGDGGTDAASGSDAGDAGQPDASVADGAAHLDANAADAGPTWSADGVYFTTPFVNLAHRGGGKLRPEHTLEAYAHALTWGPPDGGPDLVVLELDLRPTSDGAIVSMHDADVDRTTDGKGSVAAMTFEALRKLDAGHKFTTDGGKTFPWRGKGLKVPTLGEALAAFPDAVFTVEIKRNDPPIVDAVLAAFDQAGAMDRTIFAAFNDAVVHEIRAKRPDALTAFGMVEMIKFTQLKDADMATYQAPAPFAIPPWDSLTPEVMAHLKQAGVRVHTWTVNSAETMNAMLDLGVDGIFTDNPMLLAQVRKERLAKRGDKQP